MRMVAGKESDEPVIMDRIRVRMGIRSFVASTLVAGSGVRIGPARRGVSGASIIGYIRQQ